MLYVIYAIAWLVLLASALTTGNLEEGSPLRWVCVGVVMLCGIFAMLTGNWRAGVGMIGSLAFFAVKKSDSNTPEQ